MRRRNSGPPRASAPTTHPLNSDVGRVAKRPPYGRNGSSADSPEYGCHCAPALRGRSKIAPTVCIDVDRTPDAYAAFQMCCRGDLWSPADDLPHSKRTVGRGISAPPFRRSQNLTGGRKRPALRQEWIICGFAGIRLSLRPCPARAIEDRPYSLY